MATVSLGTFLSDSNFATSYTTASFTPQAGDLLVVLATLSDGEDGTPRVSSTGLSTIDSVPIGFEPDVVGQAVVRSPNAPTSVIAFLATSPVAGSPMTVTVTTRESILLSGGKVVVARIAGMQRFGRPAVRQSGKVDEGVPGGTPAISFPAVCLDRNPVVAMMGHGVVVSGGTPAGLTAPSTFTTLASQNWAGLNEGAQAVSRNGFGSATITWGSTSWIEYAGRAIELETAPLGPSDHPLIVSGRGMR